jgi:phasin family protein
MATATSGQKDKSAETAQAAAEATRRISEKSAEQAKRIGETAVEAGQEVARASAALMEQNAQTLQSALQLGLDTATTVMGRTTDQVSRVLGLSGDEAQLATERSVRNTATIIHSSTAVAKEMNGISQEYFAFCRRQFESSLDRMNELWRCRTPQDVVAVQSEFMRQTMERAVASSRHMADMSLKVTEDAARQAAQTIERRAA